MKRRFEEFIVFAQKLLSLFFKKRVEITIHLSFTSKRTIYFKETRGKRRNPGVVKKKKCLRLFYDYIPFIIAVGFSA